MRIEIEKFEKIENYEQYRFQLEKIDVATTQTISLENGEIVSNYILTKKYMDDLKRRAISFVSIIIPDDTLEELREKYSNIFETPHNSLSYEMFKKEFETYSFMNKHSKKKRRFFLCKDMYIMGNLPGRFALVKHYGDEINDEMMIAFKKVGLSGTKEIDYRENEGGILFFTDGCSENMIRLIHSFAKESGNEVYLEKDPLAAVNCYLTLNPKMVITGAVKISILTKEFLIYLRDIDPFCKFFTYEKPPSSNKENEIKQILNVYNLVYNSIIATWQTKELLAESGKLMELNDVQKKQFAAKLKEIQHAKSKQGLVDLLHVVHNLRSKYDMKSIEIRLQRMLHILPFYRK